MAEPSKAVLVTGCSSGIGRASALRLVRRAGRCTRPRGGQRRSRSWPTPGCRTLALDVTDEDSMRAAVAPSSRPRARSGVLVNNAGYSQSGAIETVPMDAVRRQFETNVFGPVRLTQLVLPKMRAQRWGKIVNVGSMGGRLTFPGGGHYHATKHALEAISDALRFELRGFGIDVILLEPGLITTEFGERRHGEHDDVGRRADGDAVRRRSQEDPYADFNATVGRGHRGRLRRARCAPRGRAGARGEGDRAGDHASTPAGANHDHTVRQALDRDPAPAERPRVGRGDARQFPQPHELSSAQPSSRLRSPEREALRVVDAVAAQHADRRLVADELGDRLPAHAANDARERPDDELVGARDGQAADEVAVDLQVAERQVLEVLERAEAGAEVVQRELAAERQHPGAECPGSCPCRRSRRSR